MSNLQVFIVPALEAPQVAPLVVLVNEAAAVNGMASDDMA